MGLASTLSGALNTALQALVTHGVWPLVQAGGSNIRFVQRLGSGSAAASLNPVYTLTASTAAGHQVLLAVKCSGGAVVSSVVDSKGNTWVVDASSAASGATVNICRSMQNVAPLLSGDTITPTFSLSGASAFAVYEYQGMAAAPLDGVPVAANANVGTSLSAGPYTPSLATDMILTALAVGAGAANIVTPPTGWTERAGTNSSNGDIDVADLFNQTAAQTAAWAWTVSAQNSAVILGYKST